MKGLRSDFMLVAGVVAKTEDSNPVKSYDKYWNLHFNFETQGYYLRLSYRSNVEYELKRAFGLIEIYHNIFDPKTKYNFMEYNTQLFAALDRLEELDSGMSPEDIMKYVVQYGARFEDYRGVPVLCNTFGKAVTRVSAVPVWGTYLNASVPVDLWRLVPRRPHRLQWKDT